GCGRQNTGRTLQFLGQERPEGCSGHPASAQDGRHPALSRSVEEWLPRSIGDCQHLRTDFPPQSGSLERDRHSLPATVLSRSRAVQSQLTRRMVHSVVDSGSVSAAVAKYTEAEFRKVARKIGGAKTD